QRRRHPDRRARPRRGGVPARRPRPAGHPRPGPRGDPGPGASRDERGGGADLVSAPAADHRGPALARRRARLADLGRALTARGGEVRAVRAAAVVAALALLTAPEIPRYRAERRIGFATGAFRNLLDRSGDPETARNIVAVGEVAVAAAGDLPGDPRPWILAGSSHLVTGQPQRAL